MYFVGYKSSLIKNLNKSKASNKKGGKLPKRLGGNIVMI